MLGDAVMTETIDNEPWFEIQRRLRGDTDGRERDALLERLNDAKHALKQRMDKGLSPSEFSAVETVHQGLESGIEVIQHVWRLHHRSI